MCNHNCIPDCDSAFWYSEHKTDCTCGENLEASATLSDPQHSETCAITQAYRNWKKETEVNDNSKLNEQKFFPLAELMTG